MVKILMTPARVETGKDFEKEAYRFPDFDFKAPSKANQNDAGWDVFIPEDLSIVVNPSEGPTIKKIPLDLQVEIEYDAPFYLECTGRSGLGSKGMLVHAGTIDKDYRGVIHVNAIFYKSIAFKKGDKIAQLIPHPFGEIEWEYRDVINTNSDRGTGGFGSSGN